MDICEIQKNTNEVIRIALIEFKERKLLDIRVYFDASETREPNFIPTKKGVQVPIKLVGELKKGVDKALAQIEQANKDGG